jgi:hypothetical protein
MATSTTTVSGQQTIPEILEPYFTGAGTPGSADYQPGLLPTAQSLFSQDYATVFQPLQEQGFLGSGRIAGITGTEAQNALRSGILGLGTPSQFGTATNYASQAASGLGNLLNASALSVGAPDLTTFQMAPTATVNAPGLNQYGMGAISANYAPSAQGASMNALQAQYTPQAEGASMSAAQTAYQPNLTTFQMQGPEQFSAAAAQRYMDPYMQNVTDIATRKAVEDAQRTQLAGNLAAGRKGTLGSSGNLLASTERERQLGIQLGDIQARGLESAYQNAQTQFERDRAAQMGAAQQNLQAQLGVQQLGTQTGAQMALANLNADQQARVQNMAAQLQTQGLNAQQALQVALSNQQAGMTAGQQNLAAALQTQGLNAQQALQVALANQQAGMTAGQQNLAAQLQTQQLGATQGLQAQQLNQAAMQEAARQNLAAALGVQQLGAQQSIQAQQANQQAALQAQQQRIAAAQGLGGLAATTGQLGVAQQATDLDRLKAVGAYGDLERAYAQQRLDAQYQDILRQIGYPEEQLAKMANILRGVPLGDTMTTQATTTPPPSFASQLAGMGLSGLSLYNLLNRG